MCAYRIERAERSDLAQILELQYIAYQSEAELCGTQDIPPLKQTLGEVEAEFEQGVILKMTAGDQIIGSVRMKCDNKVVYIGKLMVHPNYRRRGFGKRLLKEVESLFPNCTYELFTSTMSSDNIRLYNSVGYSEFRRKIVDDRLTFVYLQKQGT